MLVLARSPALYKARVTTSIALLCLGAGFALLYKYAGLMAVTQIIGVLTFIVLLMCLFTGVHLTADSISREKRDGTLGLLFLTTLTPFQIVIGKLVAHGLMGFYAVFIAVPLLSLIMIVGGVKFTEIIALGLSALNILFFSCAVGLWASARHTDRKKAAGSGTWVVMFFWWGVSLILQALNHFKAPQWLLDVVGLFTVNGMFNSAFAGPRIRIANSPWLNFAVTHLLAWTFILFATFFLKRRWQDLPPKKKFSFREWWKLKSYGTPDVRLRLRQRLLDRNPFLWLASRDRWRGVNLWLFTVGFLAFIAWQVRSGWPASSIIAMMLIIMLLVHKIMVAGAAAQQLSVEQEQGTLEMLLSTPLSVHTILKGQIAAVRQQFRGPVLLSFLILVLSLALLMYWQPFGRATALAVLGFAIYGAIHFLELYVMAWAGMWGAVTVKEAKNAAGSAMARIIFLPGLIFGLTMSIGGLVSWYWQLNWNVPPPVIVGYYLALCVVNAIGWLISFRKRLPAELREFAMRRYTPTESKSFWSIVVDTFNKRKAGQPTPPILKERNV